MSIVGEHTRMENELLVKGKIFPAHNRRSSLRFDFRYEYELPVALYDFDVVIRLTPRDVRRVFNMIKTRSIKTPSLTILHEPWRVFEGRYRFERKLNEGILKHKKLDLSIVFPLEESEVVPSELLSQDLKGLYYCMTLSKDKRYENSYTNSRYAIYRIKKK